MAQRDGYTAAKSSIKRTRMTKLVMVGCVLTSLLVWGAVCLLVVASATASSLPDGRVYEMVSAQNQEGDVYVPSAIEPGILNDGEGDTFTRLPFQIASDGEAAAYVGDPTVGGSGSEGDLLGNQFQAMRKPGGGWTQVTLQLSGNETAYYQAFSSDLSVGVLQSGSYELPSILPLSKEAPGEGYSVLYTRSSSELGYRPLFTTTPVEDPQEFVTYNAPTNDQKASNVIAYAGGSTGLAEVLFEVHGALTANAEDEPGANNLYVSAGGRLSLINVLPNGGTEANATFGTQGSHTSPPDFSHVISTDGTRVFWTDSNTGVVYLRKNPTRPESPLGSRGECIISADACTVAVSLGAAQFWTASANGRYAFYTEDEKLWRFDVEGGTGGEHEELAGEGAGVQGVVGTSEDGSYVYFVAHGKLADNENSDKAVAELGRDNLYVVRQDGAPSFIATLSPGDDSEAVLPAAGYQFGDWQPGLGHRTAEVTPDGSSAVFESNNQTIDGHSPEVKGGKLEEVYDYEAENGHLVCVSCEQNGDVPLPNLESESGLGAFLPPSWSFTYLPQWISEDGNQVFFDSTEPLVAQDTNGVQDVYEWEREGSGSCPVSTPDGCVYLLSNGVNDSASWFVGASTSGNDAFIVTRAQLAPEDGNEAYNLFDARVGGVQAVVASSCAGTGCQGVPASPPVFATPASVTFEGVGDFPQESPTKVVAKTTTKVLTRALKLARALKACKVVKQKKRRVSCEAQATKRYGAKRVAKNSATGRR